MTTDDSTDDADPGLDPADAALVSAVTGDEDTPFDLDGLAADTGATRTLLESVARTGLLLPSGIGEDGTPRYSEADARAVRAGMVLLEAGLPLGELLEIARQTDAAVSSIAEAAVEAFIRFVRDPAHGSTSSEHETATRVVTAYQQMLPATEQLVVHHLRRRLLAAAADRVLAQDDTDAGGWE